MCCSSFAFSSLFIFINRSIAYTCIVFSFFVSINYCVIMQITGLSFKVCHQANGTNNCWKMDLKSLLKKNGLAG